MSSPFLWLLGGYLTLLLGIAWTQRHRAAAPAGFYLGDRSFGALPTGFSLAATTIGASAILTQGELVYTHGFAGVWMDLSGALGLAALGLWLVPRVRQGARASLAEIAGALFGPGVRAVAAFLIVMAEVGWLALQLRGAESILIASGEVRPEWALALSVAAVVTVTALGGQHAVTWSDVVQFCVMTAGLLLVALPVALAVLGSPGAASGAAPTPGPAWNFPWGEGWPPARALEMLVMVGLPHLVGSDVYAKMLAARDETAARRGALFAAAAKLVFGVAIALIALAAARALPGLSPAASAVPAFLRQALPGGWHLVALLALMATVLSTADTVLLTATTVVLNDLIPGRDRRGADPPPERRRPTGLRGGNASPLRWGIVAALAGLAVLLATRLQTMMAIFTWSYSLFAAGLSLPILLGLLLRGRLPLPAARAGMVAGALSAAAAGLAGLRLPIAYGLAACAVGMAIFWRQGRRSPRPESRGPRLAGL